MEKLPAAMLRLFAIPLLLPWCGPALAQAVQVQINHGGIVNAASYAPAGLAAGSIAQGSIFTIFGSNLGPLESPPLKFPLDTELGGVSVLVSQGAVRKWAIPLYVSPTQINAIMPSDAPLGRNLIHVSVVGTIAAEASVNVVSAAFGIFTSNSAGYGPASVQNFKSASDQPLNTLQAAAKPGQVVILWGTGLGPVSYPDNIAPTAGSLPTRVEVFVAGQSAPVAYSGRSPQFAGTDQINFTVPSGVPAGCWVPVQVRTEGAVVSNTVTMAITSDGRPCSEPNNPFASIVTGGGSMATIELLRNTTSRSVGPGPPADVVTDLALFTFRQYTQVPFPFQPRLSLPPAGACTVYHAAGDLLGGTSPPGTANRNLDGGAVFTITGPAGTRRVTAPDVKLPTGAQIGKRLPVTGLVDTAFLDPGSFTVSGAGGVGVGRFEATAGNPAPVSWTNRDQISSIDRNQPLQVTWSPSAKGQVVEIVGGATDFSTDSSALFLCVAPPGAGSFTVPSVVLQALPATHAGTSRSSLMVGAVGPFTSFSAPGLNLGILAPAAFSGKSVPVE